MKSNTLTYPAALREQYRKGMLYGRWKKKHGQTAMFLENVAWEATTKQIPVKSPPLKSQTYGFGELFAATHYMDGHYEVTWEYWGRRWEAKSYKTASKILGQKAADFICQSQPQPPDLFVVDRKNRFFFVEVKLPGDRLNEKQRAFNRRIERYLNKNMPQSRRAPHLPKGHWIELLNLSPESDKAS
jgi:hypothetical protein